MDRPVAVRGASPAVLHGLDRVDSSGAYVVGNVVACCTHCNRAKSDRTEVEFFAWAVRVAARAEMVHGRSDDD